MGRARDFAFKSYVSHLVTEGLRESRRKDSRPHISDMNAKEANKYYS